MTEQMLTSSVEETKLMLRASRLYYEDGWTQQQVAAGLNVSRPRVSRLLQRAREQGIIEIRINDPFSTSLQLEEALTTTFELTQVIVVAGSMVSVELGRKRVGLAAARYLIEMLKDGDRVGIGWGRTLQATVSSLAHPQPISISVIPLTGGLGQVSPSFQVNEMARIVAECFGGTWHPLYAPAVSGSKEVRDSILQTEDVKQVVDNWRDLDVALVGIGNVDFDAEIQMLFVDYLDDRSQEELRKTKAVGDICMRFFDVNGHPCPEVPEGIVGIDLTHLQNIPCVVGIAGGAHKGEAILGALRGRFINILITDEAAARQIMCLATE